MIFYKFVPTVCGEWKTQMVPHPQSSPPILDKGFQLHSKSCRAPTILSRALVVGLTTSWLPPFTDPLSITTSNIWFVVGTWRMSICFDLQHGMYLPTSVRQWTMSSSPPFFQGVSLFFVFPPLLLKMKFSRFTHHFCLFYVYFDLAADVVVVRLLGPLECARAYVLNNRIGQIGKKQLGSLFVGQTRPSWQWACWSISIDKVSTRSHTRWQGVEHIAKQMQMAKYQVA